MTYTVSGGALNSTQSNLVELQGLNDVSDDVMKTKRDTGLISAEDV